MVLIGIVSRIEFLAAIEFFDVSHITVYKTFLHCNGEWRSLGVFLWEFRSQIRKMTLQRSIIIINHYFCPFAHSSADIIKNSTMKVNTGSIPLIESFLYNSIIQILCQSRHYYRNTGKKNLKLEQ